MLKTVKNIFLLFDHLWLAIFRLYSFLFGLSREFGIRQTTIN